MASNRTIEYHQQWIGYLNPTGLVFAPNALESAQVVINEGVISEQKEFLSFVTKTINNVTEFTGFENTRDLFIKILNWRESDLNANQELITQYSFSHPQFGEVVSPTCLAKVGDDKVILIQEIDQEDFDKTSDAEDTWNSSPHFKFERLLREKQVSTGMLVSKKQLRLIFAPRGESSGYIDFPFHLMYQPSGRLVFSAFRELLSEAKVFNSPKGQSLIEILELSRKYQAQVSIELSGQVLAALYELLRGFQTANDDESGKLLEKTLKENPQLIYEGLLTTLLRMVFIMYAEDRNLLATDEIYQSSYSLAGLYERLRQDEAQNPDTMDSRFGAWAHLISLFRLIYDGAEYVSERGRVTLPARHGHLFDPDIYLFLEGRNSKEQLYNKAPKISDGVVFRVLKNLLILNGERISYRTLDVEQIGSVYETMMGFELGRAEGETIALKPVKSHGAPLPINLDEILKAGREKSKKLSELSDLKLTKKAEEEFKTCQTIEEIESFLDKKIDRRATPFRLSKDAMVLVPSEARRKSGSHYTPRELTEPIVRVALEPIFKNFSDVPTPEQILDLKICDPAMGSGAFLVEACRQLSEKLVDSWGRYKIKVDIAPDENELLHARRLIAQKCLYGVDRNHMAVNLAKLSLWLVTLAKDHSFSFLDHNLKHGDSLVGVKNKQIAAFDFSAGEDLPLFQYVKDQLNEALYARNEIVQATDENNYEALKEIEKGYLELLEPLRLVGNLAIKCFFDGINEKERLKNLEKHSLIISNYFAASDYQRLTDYCKHNVGDFCSNIIPFHWELEFPEVFTRDNSGFDCFVGNPPFVSGKKISSNFGSVYSSWLIYNTVESNANADICTFFLRRAIALTRKLGTLGLIFTNTISQGDSRRVGLDWALENNLSIYNSVKRLVWPGDAAVIVTKIHLFNGKYSGECLLNGISVPSISSYLSKGGFHGSPKVLNMNSGKSFIGFQLSGIGFTVDDTNEESIRPEVIDQLVKVNPKLGKFIFKYLGGEDLYDSPDISASRRVVNLGNLELEEAEKQAPELLALLRKTVKPFRDSVNRERHKKYWWQFGETRPGLALAMKKSSHILITSSVGKHLSFALLPENTLCGHAIVHIAADDFFVFSILQSRVHECWARFFGSSMKDDLRYTPSDCFETFPFPEESSSLKKLSQVGEEYFKLRSEIMLKNSQGLTKIYNRFHDPSEKSDDILSLRDLHSRMDQEVLNAYGWKDIKASCDYISDFSLEESEDDDTNLRQAPLRLKFTESVHDEVLARLMKLNSDRYEEEVRLGLHKR